MFLIFGKAHCVEKSEGGPLCSRNALFLLQNKIVFRLKKKSKKEVLCRKNPKRVDPFVSPYICKQKTLV